MYFLKKYKILLFRSIGALIVLVAFVVQFWTTPKQGMSANERAAANVARMEAQVAGSARVSQTPPTKKSPFLEAFESKREKQMRYLSIIVMLLGLGFIAYSFMKPKEE